MDYIQANLIDPVSKVLYTYVLIYLLVAVGIYFTIRTRFIQIRYFGRMLRQVLHSRESGDGISSFQAFCIGLASRVGTGNIAGVAIALTVGGPGAIFWMWVVAAIGMATALIEATLGQIFKVRADDGSFRGGSYRSGTLHIHALNGAGELYVLSPAARRIANPALASEALVLKSAAGAVVQSVDVAEALAQIRSVLAAAIAESKALVH